MAAQLEPIVGRYMTLSLGGREHRLYFEEAGQGIPLVCLHTAGADGRQYRHLMNDEAITQHFRVLAFDLRGAGDSQWSPTQAYATTEVAEQNYGGRDTRGWLRMIVPIWTQEAAPQQPLITKGGRNSF